MERGWGRNPDSENVSLRLGTDPLVSRQPLSCGGEVRMKIKKSAKALSQKRIANRNFPKEKSDAI